MGKSPLGDSTPAFAVVCLVALSTVVVSGQGSGPTQIRVGMAKGTEVVEAVLATLRDNCLYR